jgi:purine nucleosidase
LGLFLSWRRWHGQHELSRSDSSSGGGNAVLAFIDAVRAHPGDITLVTWAPLTNIALAVRIAPDIAKKISMCYTMGGAAVTLGNVSPAAELISMSIRKQPGSFFTPAFR